MHKEQTTKEIKTFIFCDFQCRFFDNGNCVANMNLAVKRQYHPLERKARGIKYGDEETDWFRLEVWGREAEYCARAIKKGKSVAYNIIFEVHDGATTIY